MRTFTFDLWLTWFYIMDYLTWFGISDLLPPLDLDLLLVWVALRLLPVLKSYCLRERHWVDLPLGSSCRWLMRGGDRFSLTCSKEASAVGNSWSMV